MTARHRGTGVVQAFVQRKRRDAAVMVVHTAATVREAVEAARQPESTEPQPVALVGSAVPRVS